MSLYHPGQRTISCRILTFAGWIEGTFHVPTRVGFLEFLDREATLFRLSDVLLPGQLQRHPFFALERSAVVGVTLPEGESSAAGRPPGVYATHRVSWLLGSGGVVDGEVELLEGIRVSDFLMHHPGFLPIERGTIFLRGDDGSTEAVPFSSLALQASRAVGVSEIGPEPVP
jgi:hypothetical protein